MKELPLIACSLDAGALVDRQAEWSSLISASLVAAKRHPGSVALSFSAGEESLSKLRELVDLEKQCCPFYEFDIATSSEAIELVITTQPGAEEALEPIMEMFSTARSIPQP
ncbi:MAG: hypothetical protein ABR507_09335 [Actinomycetota bacterium]|nr:hypothetical protein [Actinomycetota bacterium]